MTEGFRAELHARRDRTAAFGPVTVEFRVEGAPRALDWREQTTAAVQAAKGFGFEVAWVKTVTRREVVT